MTKRKPLPEIALCLGCKDKPYLCDTHAGYQMVRCDCGWTGSSERGDLAAILAWNKVMGK